MAEASYKIPGTNYQVTDAYTGSHVQQGYDDLLSFVAGQKYAPGWARKALKFGVLPKGYEATHAANTAKGLGDVINASYESNFDAQAPPELAAQRMDENKQEFLQAAQLAKLQADTAFFRDALAARAEGKRHKQDLEYGTRSDALGAMRDMTQIKEKQPWWKTALNTALQIGGQAAMAAATGGASVPSSIAARAGSIVTG